MSRPPPFPASLLGMPSRWSSFCPTPFILLLLQVRSGSAGEASAAQFGGLAGRRESGCVNTVAIHTILHGLGHTSFRPLMSHVRDTPSSPLVLLPSLPTHTLRPAIIHVTVKITRPSFSARNTFPPHPGPVHPFSIKTALYRDSCRHRQVRNHRGSGEKLGGGGDV